MEKQRLAELDIDDFIYESIKDMQATIRAIDFKISVLLVILALPLANIDDLVGALSPQLDSAKGLLLFFVIVLLAVIFLAWAFSLYVSLLALAGLSNPSKHINYRFSPKSLFFVPLKFQFDTVSMMCGESKSNKPSLESHLAELNLLKNKSDEIRKELAFEQLKLAYIRDLKIKRFNWCVSAVKVGVFLSVILFLLFLSKYVIVNMF